MDPSLLPALKVNISDPVFIGDIFGFLLSLPVALFLANWLSAVKNHAAVVVGAFAGTLLGFLIILGWVGTLIYNTDMPGANGGNVFFGSVLFCAVMGLILAIFTDLLVARQNKNDYSRQAAAAHEQPQSLN